MDSLYNFFVYTWIQNLIPWYTSRQHEIYPHSDWGHYHAVYGSMRDQNVVGITNLYLIISLPFRAEMQANKAEVKFLLSRGVIMYVLVVFSVYTIQCAGKWWAQNLGEKKSLQSIHKSPLVNLVHNKTTAIMEVYELRYRSWCSALWYEINSLCDHYYISWLVSINNNTLLNNIYYSYFIILCVIAYDYL